VAESSASNKHSPYFTEKNLNMNPDAKNLTNKILGEPEMTEQPEMPKLTLGVAGILPVENGEQEPTIGLLLMEDGNVRWVHLQQENPEA
jgi:hypothetical protein